MDAAELRKYEEQLKQVRVALQSDAGNKDLINLEGELKNLIDLTRQLVHASIVGSSRQQDPPPKSLPKYSVGDECQAKYQSDGRWYTARIVAVGGSMQDPMYTILFKGYDETEIVPTSSLRSVEKKLSAAEEEALQRKRKRSEKKAERFATRSAEADAVQTSWQKFAKKAEKKGSKRGKSMFTTPDDPLAKVGVVGAGRGMTQYEDRKKHLF